MEYEIIEVEELEELGVRYVVIDKVSKKILDMSNNCGYLTKESAYKGFCRKAKLRKNLVPDDAIEIIKSEELTKIKKKYIVVDKNTGEVLADNKGTGFPSIKQAESWYQYKMTHEDIEDKYHYLRFLDQELQEFVINRISEKGKNLFVSIRSYILINEKKEIKSSYEVLRKRVFEESKIKQNLKKEEEELFLRIFDLCYENVTKSTPKK